MTSSLPALTSYAVARGALLAAAESAGASIDHVTHPLTGPPGEAGHRRGPLRCTDR